MPEPRMCECLKLNKVNDSIWRTIHWSITVVSRSDWLLAGMHWPTVIHVLCALPSPNVVVQIRLGRFGATPSQLTLWPAHPEWLFQWNRSRQFPHFTNWISLLHIAQSASPSPSPSSYMDCLPWLDRNREWIQFPDRCVVTVWQLWIWHTPPFLRCAHDTASFCIQMRLFMFFHFLEMNFKLQ